MLTNLFTLFYSSIINANYKCFNDIFISINGVIKKEAQKKKQNSGDSSVYIWHTHHIFIKTEQHITASCLGPYDYCFIFFSLLRFHTSTYYPRHTSSTKWYYPWYKRMRETSLTVTIYLRSSYLNLTSCFPPKERLH